MYALRPRECVRVHACAARKLRVRFARAQLRRPGVLSPVRPASPRPGTLADDADSLRFKNIYRDYKNILIN